MSTVYCDITYGTTENDDGEEVDCTYANCQECDATIMSYGMSNRSVRRCLVVMREECPNGEENYYMASGGEDK